MKTRITPTELVNLIFSIVIVLLTISGTIAFFFTDFMKQELFGWRRTTLAIIFLFYSIYRLIRLKNVWLS
jgi:hypothetical protein